jgi:hypothetical protein
MFELIRYYFEHPVFMVIHLILFLIILWKYFTSIQTLKRESLLVSHVSEATEPFGENLFFTFDSDTTHLPINYTLQSIHQHANQSPNVDLGQHVDLYVNDRHAQIEWIDKFANLFLLTGILGTLIGIFESVSQVGNTSIQMEDQLSEAFKAFGVTVFAVIYSSITNFLEMSLNGKLNLVVNKLRHFLSLALVQQRQSVKAQEERSLEVIKEAVTKLTFAIDSFDSSLVNPKVLVETLENLSGSTVHLEESLEKITLFLGSAEGSLKHLETSLSAIPRHLASTMEDTHATLENISAKIIKSIEKIQDQYNTQAQDNRHILNDVGDDIKRNFKNLIINVQDTLVAANDHALQFDQQIFNFGEVLADSTQLVAQNNESYDTYTAQYQKAVARLTENTSQIAEISDKMPDYLTSIHQDTSTSIQVLKDDFSELQSTLQRSHVLHQEQIDLLELSPLIKVQRLIRDRFNRLK